MISFLNGAPLLYNLKMIKMKSVLITGANRSIGLEIAKQLSAKGLLCI